MPIPALTSLAGKSNAKPSRVEELWKLARRRASEAGHADDWPYVMGILKKTLGLGEEYSPDDAVLLSEAVGPGPAGKLLAESLPAHIRQTLYSKYIKMENELRGLGKGKQIDWTSFLRSLRETVMVLLSWASAPTQESVGREDMVGIV
ncbi:MAG: hypothetical protein GWM98_03915 [Nitrospinaceae bacterium]|nr:hypothetical protein [Nitrospinaceae bacterium]